MLGVGAEGTRGWRLDAKKWPSVHSRRPHPVGLGVLRSPWPRRRPQNYLLLPRRPQAKSEEVHSPSRQSGKAGAPGKTRLPSRVGARLYPRAGLWELLGTQGPAEWQPSPGQGCRRPPGDPALPRARGRRAGGSEERAPRRASSPRLGWRWRQSSADRHDSRLPGYLEAAPLSHLGCGAAPLPSTAPAPAAGGAQTSGHRRGGLGERLPVCSPHSSGTPGWDTRGPAPAPHLGAGGQQPPPGRARQLGQPPARPVPSASANRYGRRCRPPTPGPGARDSRGFGVRYRGARTEGRGEGGSERAAALTSGWAGAGRAGPPPRSPGSEAPPRAPGASSEARREGAARGEAPAGSAQPHAHTPGRPPRPRAGILAAAGYHGAPGRSPSARRGRREPLVGSERGLGALLLSLSSAPVWGRCPAPPARRAPLPLPLPLAVQSPGARAQPMCAAASLSPGAQWPRPRRSCAP